MAISTEALKRIMRVRKKYSSLERIRERRRYEDAAIAIIDGCFDKLTREDVKRIIDFLNRDFRGGRSLQDRFLGGFGRDIPDNSEDDLNELFIEIYWKENLDAADSLMSRLSGVSDGFISCLLYLKDRNRYNIMMPGLIDGMEHIFGRDAVRPIRRGRTFKERYEAFNKLAHELRRICKLEPQEVDIILWGIMH